MMMAYFHSLYTGMVPLPKWFSRLSNAELGTGVGRGEKDAIKQRRRRGILDDERRRRIFGFSIDQASCSLASRLSAFCYDP
jgi:hypothetical protein